MNINQEEATVFVVLGASLAFFGALSLRALYLFWQKIKFEYNYMKFPRLVEYSQMRACQGPHKWHDVKLVLRGLPVEIYKVCTECGSIMGHDDKMVSDEVLAQMKEGLALMAQKAELERQVTARIAGLTDAYVDAYISRNFVKEINDVHFAERLRKLADYALSAQVSATEKVSAELTAQTELDDRYKDWPGKIKGNA